VPEGPRGCQSLLLGTDAEATPCEDLSSSSVVHCKRSGILHRHGFTPLAIIEPFASGQTAANRLEEQVRADRRCHWDCESVETKERMAVPSRCKSWRSLRRQGTNEHHAFPPRTTAARSCRLCRCESKRSVSPSSERSETDTSMPRLSAVASSLSNSIWMPQLGIVLHDLTAVHTDHVAKASSGIKSA